MRRCKLSLSLRLGLLLLLDTGLDLLQLQLLQVLLTRRILARLLLRRLIQDTNRLAVVRTHHNHSEKINEVAARKQKRLVSGNFHYNNFIIIITYLFPIDVTTWCICGPRACRPAALICCCCGDCLTP